MNKKYECIVFSAHPDDAFLGMGGTLCVLQKIGIKSLIICVTDGENGDTVLGSQRTREFISSCNQIGVEYITLNLTDGELMYQSYMLFREFSNILLQYNPKWIFTHNSLDLHRDHLAVYNGVNEAIDKLWHRKKGETRLRGFFQYSPIRLEPSNIRSLDFNYFVDITSLKDDKIDLILKHQSQMPNLKKNLEKQIRLNHFLGAITAYESAEGFLLRNYVPIVEIGIEAEVKF